MSQATVLAKSRTRDLFNNLGALKYLHDITPKNIVVSTQKVEWAKVQESLRNNRKHNLFEAVATILNRQAARIQDQNESNRAAAKYYIYLYGRSIMFIRSGNPSLQQ